MGILFLLCLSKYFYMNDQHQGLADIQDIKRIMERSSRFISLSGWSGIAAGICALGGAYAATKLIGSHSSYITSRSDYAYLETSLVLAAAITFIAALISAFVFTYIRSRKEGVPVWGKSALRLMFNTAIPLAAGAFVVFRMLEMKEYGLLAPSCLIFYGLALINGSKYTLGEVRYLGYCQVVLGIINLWMPGNGLLFWALGFGVLHIIYGMVMWWKYERK